ncbi:hypothetical protein D3C86_2232960 [compost metagenome]
MLEPPSLAAAVKFDLPLLVSLAYSAVVHNTPAFTITAKRAAADNAPTAFPKAGNVFPL